MEKKEERREGIMHKLKVHVYMSQKEREKNNK